MVQQLKELADILEDVDSIPSTYRVVHDYPVGLTPSSGLHEYQTHKW